MDSLVHVGEKSPGKYREAGMNSRLGKRKVRGSFFEDCGLGLGNIGGCTIQWL